MNYTAILLETQAKVLLLQTAAAQWDESLHPRGKDGRFGEKDSSNSQLSLTDFTKNQSRSVQQEATDFHTLLHEEAQPLLTAQAVLKRAQTHPELVPLGLLFGAAAIVGLKPKFAQAIATKIVEVQKSKAAKRVERRLAKKAKDTQDIAEAGRRALTKYRATGETGLEALEELEKAEVKEAAKVVPQPEPVSIKTEPIELAPPAEPPVPEPIPEPIKLKEVDQAPPPVPTPEPNITVIEPGVMNLPKTEPSPTIEAKPKKRYKTAEEAADAAAAEAAANAGKPKKKKREAAKWALGYGDAPVDDWAKTN